MKRLLIANFSEEPEQKKDSQEEINQYYKDHPDYVMRAMARNALPIVPSLYVLKGGGPGRVQMGKEAIAGTVGSVAGGFLGGIFKKGKGALIGVPVGAALAAGGASAVEGKRRIEFIKSLEDSEESKDE